MFASRRRDVSETGTIRRAQATAQPPFFSVAALLPAAPLGGRGKRSGGVCSAEASTERNNLRSKIV